MLDQVNGKNTCTNVQIIPVFSTERCLLKAYLAVPLYLKWKDKQKILKTNFDLFELEFD